MINFSLLPWVCCHRLPDICLDSKPRFENKTAFENKPPHFHQNLKKKAAAYFQGFMILPFITCLSKKSNRPKVLKKALWYQRCWLYESMWKKSPLKAMSIWLNSLKRTFWKDIKHSIVRAIDCTFLIRSFSSHKNLLLFHVAK